MNALSRLFAFVRCLALLGVLAVAASPALAAKTYSDNLDGTVTDPTTGLTWMRCSMGQTWNGTTCTGTASTYTFDQANALTGTVTFAGQSDWRVPNIRELQSMLDRAASPPMDPVAFPSGYLSYWSSTPAKIASTYGWYINSSVGTNFYSKNSREIGVRLLRGGLSLPLLSVVRPTTDYLDHGDGTVTHIPSGLMWLRCSEGQTWTGTACSGTSDISMTWFSAVQLAKSFAGYADWRIPTENELLSLVDYTLASPAQNSTIFSDTQLTFWSKLPQFGVVSFSYGNLGQGSSNVAAVRYVRAGNVLRFFMLTASKSGSGTVQGSDLTKIDCGTVCVGDFFMGTQVILAADPVNNFIKWGGACASAGSAPTCTVTMDAEKTVTATFKDTPMVSGLPSALTFTTQNIASTSTVQPVTLSNSGTAPLIINSIVTTGDYVVSHNCGTGLSAGGFCTLNVVFSPTASGTRTGTITLISDDPNSPYIIALSGIGQAGTSVVSTSSLVFSSQGVGSVSVAKTLTLSNSGGTELNIASISTTGSFASTTTCGTKLAAGSQCSIRVTFNPAEVGSLTGTAVISSDAHSSPTTVNLSGIGVAVSRVALHPTVLSFIASTLGASSAAQTITLTNGGGATLTLSGLTVTGDFNEVNNCGGGLSAGASCNIKITFTPTAMGGRTGTLTLISNALGSPHSVALTGGPVATTLDLAQGWNLLGNGMDEPMSAATLFGDPLNVISAWKWDVANAGWKCYAPSMDAAALQSYAAGKNYGVLTNINPGEGFWVNATKPFTVAQPSGVAIAGNDFQDGKPASPKLGWNLISIGNALTPSAFNIGLSAVPPSAGAVPINVTSLWAWDNPQGKWYFYAPNLEGQGGTALTDYITGKAYLDFTTNSKTLGPGVGFWVNRP